MKDIILTIVDADDNVIGYKPASELDRKNDIYRVSSAWITNGKNELLMAQSSFNKKIYPGVWDVGVAGRVEKGETYESNIKKEAMEELALEGGFTLGPKVRIAGEYNMFIQWFFLRSDRAAESFDYQKEEVEQVKWFARDDVVKGLKEEPEKFIALDMARWVELFWK